MKKYFVSFFLIVFICISYAQEEKYPFASKVRYYSPDDGNSFADAANLHYKILLDSSQNRIDCREPEPIYKDAWKPYRHGNDPFYRSQIYALASKEAEENYNFRHPLYGIRYTIVGEQNEYFMINASNSQYNEYAWILISRTSGKIISSRLYSSFNKDSKYYYQILSNNWQNSIWQELELIDNCMPKAYMPNSEIYDLASKAAKKYYNLDIAVPNSEIYDSGFASRIAKKHYELGLLDRIVRFEDWPVTLMFENGVYNLDTNTVYVRHIVVGEQNEYILARIRIPGEEYQIFVLISRISEKVVSTYKDEMPSLFSEMFGDYSEND